MSGVTCQQQIAYVPVVISANNNWLAPIGCVQDNNVNNNDDSTGIEYVDLGAETAALGTQFRRVVGTMSPVSYVGGGANCNSDASATRVGDLQVTLQGLAPGASYRDIRTDCNTILTILSGGFLVRAGNKIYEGIPFRVFFVPMSVRVEIVALNENPGIAVFQTIFSTQEFPAHYTQQSPTADVTFTSFDYPDDGNANPRPASIPSISLWSFYAVFFWKQEKQEKTLSTILLPTFPVRIYVHMHAYAR